MMKLCTALSVTAVVLLGTLVSPSEAFIRTQDTRFVDENCNDINFVGANAWRVLEAQAGVVGVKLNDLTPTEWMFKTAAANNISVIRMFATGVLDEFPLQTKPGEYNEKALKALDESLDLASKYGVMVTLILARMWQGPDALSNYASWTGTPIEQFFSDQDAINSFLDHISFMSNRTNTVNGKKYSDDATIFSWNLMNEPRYFGNVSECQSNPSSCADTMNNWIKTTSDHLKSVDPNHMIGIGSEGFFGPSSPYTSANPEGGWAEKTGQDFERNTKNPSIDYAEIHLWPDNWKTAEDPQFIGNWIEKHIEAAESMGLPLHLEEFGKNSSRVFDANSAEEKTRRDVFTQVFDKLEDSLKNGRALRAASYWMFDPTLQNTNSPGYDRFGQDQVPTTSYTFTDIIVPAAKSAASSSQGTVQGCTPGVLPAQKEGGTAAAGGRKLLLKFWNWL